MDVLKKINYLFDRKVKISLVGLFFVILVGSAVELLGVSIVCIGVAGYFGYKCHSYKINNQLLEKGLKKS